MPRTPTPDPQPTLGPQTPQRPSGGGRHGNGLKRGDRKLTDKSVLEALQRTSGVRAAAARVLGVSASTLYSYLAERPGLKEALHVIDEELVDLVEGKLLAAVRRGDIRAITFFLSTKGKHRGYSTRIEQTGADGEPIQVAIPIPSVDEMMALLIRLADERRKGEDAEPGSFDAAGRRLQ